MSICSGRCNHAIAEDQSHEIRFACGLTAGVIEEMTWSKDDKFPRLFAPNNTDAAFPARYDKISQLVAP